MHERSADRVAMAAERQRLDVPWATVPPVAGSGARFSRREEKTHAVEDTGRVGKSN